MKLIKISTELELTVHEFPTGNHSEQNDVLRKLIDEEGRLKENPVPNMIGSYLYETDKHGNPIMGDILFVGEEWSRDGIDFCGIDESVFNMLELQLNNMIYAMRATMEVLK